ncbi:hypothetical protein EWM64_g3446 [Hericium alpestre]|uniref:Cytochrome P450 n=1 Tax=Hericium alpestre TaxID=135208 RepID=A0A4Z0A0B7_9AGAM|nr:hypothetical protein EWM64_g3446 [Hericium alpestre]
MAGELVGWDLGIGYASFAPSSDYQPIVKLESPYPVHSNVRFRTMRKLSHAAIGPQGCAKPDMIAMQEQQRTRLLTKIVQLGKRHKEGCDFEEMIKLASASLVLKITYGYQVISDKHDKLVEIADNAMAGFGAAASPGAFWVDYLPILKRVPAWFPGAGFKKAAQQMRAARERLYDIPFELVKSKMASRTVPPSMVSTLLASEAHSPADEELVKAIAASLYSASVETTQSSLMSFLLAMLLHPDVQRRAQAELDALLGLPSSASGSRIPSVHDRVNLPYINALVKEVWRWNPSVPVGLPHRVTQDDVYRGFFIRKGTIVYPNIWSMFHDPETYPSPFEFIPDRFLNDGSTLKALEKTADPSWIAFGFGRRICPGMHIADSSVFLYIASMLYLFDVVKAKDEDGGDIEPKVEYDGFISQPSPFKCRLVPRSAEVEEMIAREGQDVFGGVE